MVTARAVLLASLTPCLQPWPSVLAATMARAPGVSAAAVCDAADELEEAGQVTREPAPCIGGMCALLGAAPPGQLELAM